MASGTTTGLPGYFIAEPVRAATGAIIGVITIKVGLSDLQDRWRDVGEQVFLANEDGVILLSSDPDWLYRTTTPLSPAQHAAIDATRQFPGQALSPLPWQPQNHRRRHDRRHPSAAPHRPGFAP